MPPIETPEYCKLITQNKAFVLKYSRNDYKKENITYIYLNNKIIIRHLGKNHLPP